MICPSIPNDHVKGPVNRPTTTSHLISLKTPLTWTDRHRSPEQSRNPCQIEYPLGSQLWGQNSLINNEYTTFSTEH